MSFKLEICTPNFPSIEAAVRAKAHRIELCSSIETGGLTPPPSAIRFACKQIETHVLIRPRSGHFLYSHSEIKAMQQDIIFCKKAKAAGAVFGVLNKKNMPNKYDLKKLVDACEGMDRTFNRAFDLCKEPLDALEVLIDLGFTRILTSGKGNTAWEGREMLQKLQERANGRISIMAAGGISPENILDIQRATGCRDFHASAKRRSDVGTANPIIGLSEQFLFSDIDMIRNMKMALEYAV